MSDLFLIGSSAHASVYRARLIKKEVQQDVAVKVWFANQAVKTAADQVFAEQDCLSELGKQFAVQLHHYCYLNLVGRSYPALIMELCECDLAKFIDVVKPALDAETITSFISQLLRAYDQCFKLKLAHRDVKAENILVKRLPNGKYCVKLCDFAFSKRIEDSASVMCTFIGTYDKHNQRCWLAPEIYENNNANKSEYRSTADIFSLGCVFYFLATSGQALFSDPESTRSYTVNPQSVWARIAANVAPLLADLIINMIQVVPAARIPLAKALTHPYFLDSDGLENMVKVCIDDHKQRLAEMACDGDFGCWRSDAWLSILVGSTLCPANGTSACQFVTMLRNFQRHGADPAKGNFTFYGATFAVQKATLTGHVWKYYSKLVLKMYSLVFL